jgi:uncharacterized protein (TIGR00251 family)
MKPKSPVPSALIEVNVQPRASREGLSRAADGTLRVRVNAAPVEGEANEAVLKALSKALGLPKSRLTIERGQTSRRKLIRISGLAPEELERLLPAPEP